MLMEKKDKLIIFQEIFIGIYICVLFAIEIANLYSVLIIGGLAVFSAAYVLTDFFKGANFLRSYKIDFLILFLGINVLSMLVNYKYGLTENILSLFTLFVDFFILYNVGGSRSEKQVNRFFYAVSHVFILLYTSAALFSLMGFCLQHENVFYIGERMFRHGFVENRLFGIFPDPNYAAINCIVVAMICVYYAIKNNDKLITFFYYSFAAINLCYMILSGSRTGMLSLLGGILVCGYFYAFRKYRHKESRVRRQAICVATAIIMTAIALVAMEGLRFGLTYIPPVIGAIRGNEMTRPVSLARDDVEQSEDYSNNRLKIWKSAFRVFVSKPLVGTSPRNMTAYAQDQFPASYIATSKYMVHNSLFETLVFSGLMGFTVLCVFIGSCAYHTFKHLYTRPDDHFPEVILGTMIIITMMVSSLTLSALFYNRGGYNSLFWLSLGYLTYFTCPKRESNTLKISKKLFRLGE